jgi:hypothetical protein
MADSADVENAIEAMLSAALYPNGTGAPSLIGSTISIHRGWPTEANIATATSAGSTWIAIHADKAMSKDATRYLPTWQGTPGVCTITATVAGLTVTMGGVPAVGQTVAVQSKGLWYTYAPLVADTLATIAAAFAGAIPGASSVAAVLTLPATGDPPQARVGMIGTASIEAAREQQVFRVCVWSPTPTIRDAVFGQIPGIIGYLGSRLTMPDGSTATRMAQRQTGPDDMPAKALMWRRDLLVTYDFAVNYQTPAGTAIVISQPITINGATVKYQGGDVLNSAQASIL